MRFIHVDAGVNLKRNSRETVVILPTYVGKNLATSTKPKCYQVLDLLNAASQVSISASAWLLDTSGHEFNLILQSMMRNVGDAGTRE